MKLEKIIRRIANLGFAVVLPVLAADFTPPLDTTLNDFDPTTKLGRYIQNVASDITPTHTVVVTNNIGGEIVITTNVYDVVFQDDLDEQLSHYVPSTNLTDKANASAIAPVFDVQEEYAIGDMVMYEGALYFCIENHSGPFTPRHFSPWDMEAELSDVWHDIANLGEIKEEKPLAAPLCFTSENPGVTIRLVKIGNFDSTLYLKFSLDGGVTWSDYTVGDTITLPYTHSSVLFCAKDEGNTQICPDISGSNYYKFQIDGGRVAATGDLTSLLGPLAKPSFALPSRCFNSLFAGCTNLTHAPALPATQLGPRCYQSLFSGCSQLKEAPYLPATSLAKSCYLNMFLNASNISKVSVAFTAWYPENATANWLSNVASKGEFYCPPSIVNINSGDNTIPLGWVTNPSHTVVESINGMTGIVELYAEDLGAVEKNRMADYVKDIPIGNYANMDSIADRLDMVIHALKDIAEPDNKTMYFRSLADGSTVSMTNNYNAPVVSLEYSVDDGDNWAPFIVDSTTVTLNKGKWMRIRATEGAVQSQFAQSASSHNNFILSGSLIVGGNAMSLFYHDYQTIAAATSFPNADSSYVFARLFANNTALVGASTLILPATNIVSHGYAGMFQNCSSLTTAPELPATILANNCYDFMFDGCSSLTTAPELPATNLADSCYMGMFRSCSSIITSPELPATNLADLCYYAMFIGCKSLTVGPELPARSLADGCYKSMFSGCSSLTTVSELPSTNLSEQCYGGMFSGCTSLTTAPELPAVNLVKNGYADMFQNCSSLTIAPELPATNLADSCYSSMFYGCTSLTAAPELPATTLANQCYKNMFFGCTSLMSMSVDFTAWSPSEATATWLVSVASNGVFHCKPTLDVSTRNSSTIPADWTIITDR